MELVYEHEVERDGEKSSHRITIMDPSDLVIERVLDRILAVVGVRDGVRDRSR